jgi:hypothetical protein
MQTLTLKPAPDGTLDMSAFHDQVLASAIAAIDGRKIDAADVAKAGTIDAGGISTKGFIPSTRDLMDDLKGGYAAIALAKAIQKALPVTDNAAVSDYLAWQIISRWGKMLGSGAQRSAQTVLTVDAARALFPVLDGFINQAIAAIPTIYKGTPFHLPSIASTSYAAPVSAMRNSPGGGKVIRGHTLNI